MSDPLGTSGNPHLKIFLYRRALSDKKLNVYPEQTIVKKVIIKCYRCNKIIM